MEKAAAKEEKAVKMEMEELKPCPFCGGKAKVDKIHPSFMLKKFHYLYLVAGCTKCNVATPLFRTRKTGSLLMNEHYDEKAKEKAIKAWNKRV